MRILALDIGTSSVKAGIVSSRGDVSNWLREGLSFDRVVQESSGLAERWLTATERITRRIAAHTVDAVVLSGNGPTIVPVGSDDAAVGPVLLWIDTGRVEVPGCESFFLPKIAWFREHHPEQYASTRWFLSCPEYVAFTLTHVASTVRPTQEFAPYVWDDESIEAYEIDRSTLPGFVDTGDVIGTVTREAAERFSLPAGIPVYAGGADFLMCLLGTATVRPGRTCDRAGTSEGINFCAATKVRSTGLRTLPHVIPGRYNVAGILSSTGRLFEWFRRISGQQDKSYERMLSEISRVEHDRSIPTFLPSLHRGATWDFSGAAFMGLEPHHGIDEMGRAVVESIGYSIRDLIRTLEEAGCRVDELRVSGGQARNRSWNQMKADMTGCVVTVGEVIDAELLGNAAACLYGSGEYGSLIEAAESLYRPARRFEPDREEHLRFEEGFRRFCEFRRRVAGEPISDAPS